PGLRVRQSPGPLPRLWMALELLSVAGGVRYAAVVPPVLEFGSSLPAPSSRQCLNAVLSAGVHHCHLPACLCSPLWALRSGHHGRLLEAFQFLLLPGAAGRICRSLSADRALFSPGVIQ